MAKKFNLLFVLVLAFALLCATLATIAKAKRMHPQRVTMKLIHHNSIYSPFYNPNAIDNNNRLFLEYKRSLERWAYVQAKARGGDDIRAPIIPTNVGTLFMVNFSIGTPPVPQLVLMDTASNLLWVQCEPCHFCWEQSVPLFDPTKSSTYKSMSCYSNNCLYPPIEGKCGVLERCLFHLEYVDESRVSGEQATETLTFQTSDEGLAKLPDKIFGCASQAGYGPARTTQPIGVMGLGASPVSLPRSFGDVFSYCLGDINNPSYAYNHLTLGQGSVVEGFSIPMEIYNGLYFVPMEGISFGGRRLDIDPAVFQRKNDDDGIVLDSGTTLIVLPKPAYDLFKTEITRFLGPKFKQAYDFICYTGSLERDVAPHFPITEFHFAGGQSLAMAARNVLFQPVLDMYCLGILPSTSGGGGMIGAFAQQGYNIAYNLLEKKIYFQRVDCRNLY